MKPDDDEDHVLPCRKQRNSQRPQTVPNRVGGGGPVKIILHIGDAKCGSSSIQASLYQARETLLSRGVLYHPASTANGHFSYITLLNGKTRGDNADQEAMARANIAATREMIAEHRPEYLIVSGESLFSVVPDLVMGLLTEITGTPAPVHVVAFLRHPVDFYLSGVQQGLKASHEFTSPLDFIRDTPGTFRRWSAFPGCDSVTARLFDRSRLTGGSVVTEFNAILRSIIGPDLPELPDANKNTSLSAEQMVVLQQYRRDFLADRKGQFVSQSNWIVSFFEELNQTGSLVGTQPTLTDGVRACIASRNARFTKGLDDMFPDLGMAELRSIPPVEWEAQAAGWTGDIANILAGHDPEIVQALMALLPDYDPALETDDGISGLREKLTGLGLGQAAHRPYFRYLDRSGRKAMADKLRKRLKGPSRT